MPIIPSANPDFGRQELNDKTVKYRHGVDERKSFIPMAFQITSPVNPRVALLPHALVLHINPSSFEETMTKKEETIQTRGGFVEQVWGDELGAISASASTGAFINLKTGLSSVMRQQTIAWDRYRDLLDLYKANGCVFSPDGAVVLRGRVMLIYDRGTYIGHFESFSNEETDTAPFVFSLSWGFKVEECIVQVVTPRELANANRNKYQSGT